MSRRASWAIAFPAPSSVGCAIGYCGTTAVCQCSIYAMDGKAEHLIAVAQGTIVAASRDRRTTLTGAP